MMQTQAAVIGIVRETLGLEAGRRLDAATALFGVMPEFDSLAVVELALAIERRFGITIDDEDFGSELFASIGSLSAYVDRRLDRQPAVAALAGG